ncbi:hypothetical protein MFUL124B02_10935 [Myxococcus fulvus 124B02]|nr:hypothetical protein MFUL124B02_10935 [Myxococcus fulvus 124B02]
MEDTSSSVARVTPSPAVVEQGVVPPLTNWNLATAAQRMPNTEMPFFSVEKFDVDNYADIIFEESFNPRAQILRRSHTTVNCYSGGCARFDVRPGYVAQGDTGLVLNHQNGQRANVGYMLYYGRDWPATMRGAGHKHVLVYDDVSNGGRNIRPMVTESGLETNAGAYAYRGFRACNNAAGICADEFSSHWAPSTPTTSHAFKMEQFLEQWLYVEFEVVIGGLNTLYIWSRDGRLQHRIGFCNGGVTTEGWDCRNINVAAQPLDYSRILAYFGDRPNNAITTNSYVLIDNIRVGDAFMGPPAGFLQTP